MNETLFYVTAFPFEATGRVENALAQSPIATAHPTRLHGHSFLAKVRAKVRAQAEPGLPQLDRIDLYETPGCGVVLSWGEHEPGLPV